MAPERPLTTRLIVDTALDLVDADGLAGLTVRRLGAALGVEGMAVYHHIANKDALIDALVARVSWGEDEPLPPADLPWDRRLSILYWRFRASVLRHPNMAELVLTRPARDRRAARGAEAQLRAYHDAGLPPSDVVSAYRTVGSYVIGYVAIEVRAGSGEAVEPDWDAPVPDTEFPFLASAAAHAADRSWDEQFADGLEIQFAAIRSRVRGR